MRAPASTFLLILLLLAAPARAEPPMSVTPSRTPTPRSTPSSDPWFGDTYGLPGASSERALRARDNLRALLEGRIYTSDLSPQDLQDVIDFDRMARGVTPDNRSFKQQCIDDEVARNGGNPTRLAWEVIRLKCQ